MADIKEKHPTWFKMKIERRQLIKQLPAETAVNVLLACWDYLKPEKSRKPCSRWKKLLSVRSFRTWKKLWTRYEQRVKMELQGGRPTGQ